MVRKLVLFAAAAALLAFAPAFARAEKVRFAFNPGIYNYLPIYVAMEKGFFAEEKIEVETQTYGGSSLSVLPMLVRGDIDISPMAAGPAFFNQHELGFDVKLIASIATSKQGWNDTVWLMVRKDLWDKGEFKTLADLKGRTIEGGPKGSPIYLMTIQSLVQAKLGVGDVTLTQRFRSVSDAVPLFRNKAIDAMSMVEPMVARLEAEGLAVRWKPTHEVMPWFQEAYLAASPKMRAEKRDVVKGFLKAFLRGAQVVTASEGKWTPELVQILSKWSKMSDDVIRSIPGPSYPGLMGVIDVASLARQQDIWVGEGMLKSKTTIAELVDTTMIDEVRRDLGVK